MADYNKVMLLGRLTRDPERKKPQAGSPSRSSGSLSTTNISRARSGRPELVLWRLAFGTVRARDV